MSSLACLALGAKNEAAYLFAIYCQFLSLVILVRISGMVYTIKALELVKAPVSPLKDISSRALCISPSMGN